MKRGAIDQIAKSSEIQQLCLGAAKGIVSAAEGIMPEAEYRADVVVGQTRARARARAYPPDWSDADARREFYQFPPIFGITPRFR